MAGCQWKKFHGANESKAVLQHNDKEERKQHTHSNLQLDTSKTDLNFQLFDWTYEEKCKVYDSKVKELEENVIRLKKDRVTMVGIDIPIPNEIPDEKVGEFVLRSMGAVSDVVGAENIIAVDEHSDEQHTYIDAETKEERLSMRHIHFSCVPGVDGKLNGKQFCTRDRMIKLNNEMQAICENQFDCKFMTGEKTKSSKNVENLKFQSQQAKAVKDMEDAIALNERATERHMKAAERESAVEDREYKAGKKEKELDEKQEHLERWEKDLRDREILQRELESGRKAFDEIKDIINKKLSVEARKDPKLIKSMSETEKALKTAENVSKRMVDFEPPQY